MNLFCEIEPQIGLIRVFKKKARYNFNCIDIFIFDITFPIDKRHFF